MSELTNTEVMENQMDNGVDIATDHSVDSSGSGRTIGLTVGLITGAIGLGTLAYKKFKSKKKDETSKKKLKKSTIRMMFRISWKKAKRK